MTKVNVTLPPIQGATGQWEVDGGTVAPGKHTLPIGTVLVENATGLHRKKWLGARIHRVEKGGLVALHNGWWDGDRECGKIIAAIGAAKKGCPATDERLAPRTPEGRRRDHTSASQASRWLTCPGSVRLADEVAKPRESSSYADEGTAAHEMAENCLLFGLDAESMTGVDSGVGVELVDEMVEHVQLYLDTIRADQAADGGTIQVENDVSVPAAGLVLRGTFDATLWSPEKRLLRVYDLKYGQGMLVDVRENPQLRICGLGAMIAVNSVVDEIEMVIVQPRRASEDRDGDDTRVRRERLTAKGLSDWYTSVLVPGVEALRAPNAPFTPTTDGCRWCPAAYACPALANKSLSTAKEVFRDLTLAEIPAAAPDKKAMRAAVVDMSAERVAEILAIEPIAMMWLKLVNEHARALLEHGEAVPGWKLVGKTGNRAWSKDDDGVVDAITTTTGVEPSECFAEPKLLSPAQMEKMLGKDKRAVVDTLTHKPNTGATMVPESDRRPALDRDPANVFGVVE